MQYEQLLTTRIEKKKRKEAKNALHYKNRLGKEI